MGLFSFIKEAGEKMFGSKEEAVIATKTAEEIHAEREKALLNKVLRFELPIDNLSVQIVDDKAIVSGITKIMAVRELVIVTIGNTEGIASVEDNIEVIEPTAEASFYTVVKGDYLSKIAKKAYGDAMKYPIIFEANKPMLTDPDKIYPGQVLRIPPLEEK